MEMVWGQLQSGHLAHQTFADSHNLDQAIHKAVAGLNCNEIAWVTSQLSYRGTIDVLRHSIKRAVRDDRFRWLALPARKFWYYWRTFSELQNVPEVLLRLRKSQRSLPSSQLIELVFTHFGGMFRPFQLKIELQRFMARVEEIKPQTIIEIGTARGGTLFLLSCVAAQNAQLISVDLPAGLFGGGYPFWKGLLYRWFIGDGQKLHLIRGNSHDTRTFDKTQRLLTGRKVDLLFIDGDHSYDGAKCDFLRYRTLVRPGGLIAFHDIVENRTDPDITVAPLWREIAQSFQTEEILQSYDQGECGIGILTVPKEWNSAQRMA
jgi:predicted O-methyltransferase YrrM